MESTTCPFCKAVVDGRPARCPACRRPLPVTAAVDSGGAASPLVSGSQAPPTDPVPTVDSPTPPVPATEPVQKADTGSQSIFKPVTRGRLEPKEHVAGGGDQVPILAVDDDHVVVQPGGSGSVTVTVINGGAQVDEIVLAVEPRVDEFAAFDRPTVTLFSGGDRAEVTLTFRPPRTPQVYAGRYGWTVRATSKASGRSATVAGTVDVMPFAAPVLDVDPPRTSGRRRTFQHVLTVRNDGNSTWAGTVEPEVSDRALLVAVPPTLTVAPGDEVAVALQGRASRRLIGAEEAIDLHVDVTTHSEPRLQAWAWDGRRHQRALLPKWVLAAAAVLLALAILLFTLLRQPTRVQVPVVEDQPRATAVEMLRDAGFEVSERTEEHPSIAEGRAIGTTPSANSEADEGSVVVLVVSSGPPEEQVAVPGVIGRTEGEARQVLEGAGLTVRVEEQPDLTIPVGDVIRTDPPSAQLVDQGTEITVFVSTGPLPTPGPDELVEVPDVVGSTEAQALAALADAGLSGRVERQPNVLPAGEVMATDPAAEEEVEAGTEVLVVVSEGPVPQEIPEYDTEPVQVPLNPARDLIEAVGVRQGANADHDRIVIDMDAPLDGYEVDYLEPGILQVRIENFSLGDAQLPSDGVQDRILGVEEVPEGDGETVVFNIEMSSEAPPFRAFTLLPSAEFPYRFVIDVTS